MKNLFSYIFTDLVRKHDQLTLIKSDAISFQNYCSNVIGKWRSSKRLKGVYTLQSYSAGRTVFVTLDKFFRKCFLNFAVSDERISASNTQRLFHTYLHSHTSQFFHLDPTINIIYGPKAIEARQLGVSLICPANANGTKKVSLLVAKELKSGDVYRDRYVVAKNSTRYYSDLYSTTSNTTGEYCCQRNLYATVRSGKLPHSTENYKFSRFKPFVVSRLECFDKDFSP